MGRPLGRPSHDGLSTAPDNAHAVRRRRRTALRGRTWDRAPGARRCSAGELETAPQPMKRLRFGVGFGKPKSFSRP